MQHSKNDIWVGLFVLLGGAALVFLALQSANLLQLNLPKAAVRSAGVVVGRVQAIDFDDTTYQARVTLELEKQFAFPKDSSLKILTSGLLGDQYIGIEPGADETNLAEGDMVTATQSAVVLENLIGQFLYGKAEEGASSNAGGPKK